MEIARIPGPGCESSNSEPASSRLCDSRLVPHFPLLCVWGGWGGMGAPPLKKPLPG